jgi:tRNA threonylcarbamoyladenosine biosynthesis protein TsaB
MDENAAIELAIDTASAVAGVAVSARGVVLAEITWRARISHEAELVPAIDTVLRSAGVEREAIHVLFVNRGPGGYAGLRVGAGVAMGIALALGAELVGVGRLDLDAYPHAAYPGPVCAVHQAGRGEIAWAVYEGAGEERREAVPPRLDPLMEFVRLAPRSALFCGEVAGLEETLQAIPGTRLATGVASLRRAGTLAELGWQRYAAGRRDDPRALDIIYLREPAITRARRAPGEGFWHAPA